MVVRPVDAPQFCYGGGKARLSRVLIRWMPFQGWTGATKIQWGMMKAHPQAYWDGERLYWLPATKEIRYA